MENLDYNNSDGLYSVRRGSHKEQVIQVPQTVTGQYWRFVEDEGRRIIFVKKGI